MDYLSRKKKTKKQRLLRWLNYNKLYIAMVVFFLIVLAIVTIVRKPTSEKEQAESQVYVTICEKQLLYVPEKSDVDILAKLIYGEARGVESTAQKAAVVWCVLNRVDSPDHPNTIEAVVKQKSQFDGYNDKYPVTDELREIAEDVLIRWHMEKDGNKDVGRTLPSDYLFFVGDGVCNYFSAEWRSNEYYDWSLPSPYVM